MFPLRYRCPACVLETMHFIHPTHTQLISESLYIAGPTYVMFIYLFIIYAFFNEGNILQCQCTAFQAGTNLDNILQYLQ